ncbi:PA1571 family protein [Sansalvadorimonas verongulae]|uniref:PA1571 family protein n=1 Tax=Sansalvadorimonas verongulae TaxID=2172824 RepID=UPI0012BB52D1|nr:PA1571 family protein [Sansalvadorimonas verongulae]MTI14817.1 hypothetical protein [Sansalvadorimonas verongulae]
MNAGNTLKPLQDIVGANNPMFVAAIITDDGVEVPITTDMIEKSINRIENENSRYAALTVTKH